MRTMLLWVITASCLLVPFNSVRIAAALLLMTLFPGALIWSWSFPEEKNFLVFILCGSAFLSILVYYCAWFVFFFIPVAVSFACAVILEVRKVPLHVNRETLLLLGCVLFLGFCVYPWGNYVALYPPGDEMKLHLLYAHSIVTERVLPSDYGPLYPEVKGITQPLGFHGMAAFVAAASRSSIIPTGTLVGIFMASLGCISMYLLGDTLSRGKGLYFSFSFAFFSFVSHQLGLSGSYVFLAGFTFQMGAAALIVRAASLKTRTSYIMAGLFCAACFSTDLSAFFTLMCFFILFLALNRSSLFVVPAFILFSLPQLARFTFKAPTSLETRFIEEWFHQNLITSFGEAQIILFSLGPLLLIFAVLQLLSVKRNKDKENLVLGLYSIPFLIPVLMGSYFPLWYYFNPVLIFRMITIPFTVLAALFLIQLNRKSYWFIGGLALFSAVLHIADPFAILPPSSPTVNGNSLSAYEWIVVNTSPDSSFCNFASSGDSSTWIPIAADRKVILPFYLYYYGDNAMSQLNLPERFTDLAIIRTAPHSELAREILEKYKIEYIYLDGESSVDHTLLNGYTLEFHKGDTYIFSVQDAEFNPCKPLAYSSGRTFQNGVRSYLHFSQVKGTYLGIYYVDKGFGNVDVDINGDYSGTVFRFDTQSHFLALFALPPSEDITVTLFPYGDTFFVDSCIIFECGE